VTNNVNRTTAIHRRSMSHLCPPAFSKIQYRQFTRSHTYIHIHQYNSWCSIFHGNGRSWNRDAYGSRLYVHPGRKQLCGTSSPILSSHCSWLPIAGRVILVAASTADPVIL